MTGLRIRRLRSLFRVERDFGRGQVLVVGLFVTRQAAENRVADLKAHGAR
jgi:hypothetical protein